MKLSRKEQQELMALARAAIRVKERPARGLKAFDSISDKLLVGAGTFVSIYVEGDLRGCIGTFSEEQALYKNVQKMAVSAASLDSRFKPLSPAELDQMEIEISVLSPLCRIYDISEIILGKHGIFIKKGRNRGTFLPQVAENQNWTVEEFLGNCAKHKAGIGWDGWKMAELYTYEAFIIRSEDLQ